MSQATAGEAVYDLAIIGGGINGCGIARDAAGRGLSVLLLEQSDLASGTSSASTKLIHGGLRYLEHYEFRLVREALSEREVLLRMAPHIVRPMRFVLPHHDGLRPRWMIRLGLFLYDHLGGRRLLPGTRTLDLAHDPAGEPLKPEYRHGFEYSDCWVDDARMVVANARDAAERGADIRVRTRCTAAERHDGLWRLAAQDLRRGTTAPYRARVLVNAGGPWVLDVLHQVVRSNAEERVRLVQGSHVVVPRLFAHERSYIFQNPDGRICFAIPYEDDFTLIGTTDRDYEGDPAQVAITPGEVQYLCEAVSAYLKISVRPEQVVWTYAGVRPLYDDGATAAQDATRDYVLRLDAPEGAAPLLNVFGGKITTYRRLAEAALAEIASALPEEGGRWTAGATLPGGAIAADGLPDLAAQMQVAYPFLDARQVGRLVRTYGTRLPEVLGPARTAADLGTGFGAGLSEREVRYLMDKEWAVSAADVIWRRTKLGLRLTAAEVERLEAWMAERAARAPATA